MERRKFSSRKELRDAIEKPDGTANTWDVSAITDMSFLFQMTEFNEAIDQWDTSNVTDMEGMFMSSSFNQDISRWNVSNVTNMSKMFKGHMLPPVFNQPLPWNVSRVENMEGMFMNSIFNHPLEWDTSSVTNMKEMFCRSQMNQPLSLDVSKVVTMEGMFQYSTFDQDISKWKTSSVTNMKNMFYGSKFNYPLPWDVSKVVTMERMFTSSLFNQDISEWDVGNVTNMSHMFEYSKFYQNIRAWNVEKVTEMTNMFSECPILDSQKPRVFVFPTKEIKKKITIFVDMHGENLKEELPFELPLHTSLAVRPGICSFMFDKTTTETLQRIEAIEDDYQGKPIFAGNNIYGKKFQPFENYYFERNFKDAMKSTPSHTEKELFELHKERTSPFRRIKHNRLYTISDDNRAVVMGIYIINVQVNNDDIDIEYPESIQINSETFTPTRSEYVKGDYMSLQRRNLLNVEVANSFVKGGFKLDSNDDYTNIEHVPSITLLDILLFFKKMGFDYVNIIDEGCRGENISPVLRNRKSFIEHDGFDDFRKEFPGLGGKRKTRLRKKVRTRRRTHKRR